MTSSRGTSEPGVAEPGFAEPGWAFREGPPPPTPTNNSPFCVPNLKSGERLLYIQPDNVKFLLHAPPSRAVTSEEGFGMPPLEYVTDRYPFQHGDTVRSFALQPRALQLVVLFNFNSRGAYRNGRAELLDTIRPNRVTDFSNGLGKLLKYCANNTKRQLDVLIDSGPGFAPPQGGWREWSFTEVLRFVAHDPTWYNPILNTTIFDNSLPTAFQRTISYAGTWPEQPSFVVTGPINTLELHNHTTGELITLNYNLAGGRSLTITLRGTKSILLDDNTNLMPYLSATSALTTWALQPGNNVIHIHGTSTSGATSISMRWYERFIGI